MRFKIRVRLTLSVSSMAKGKHKVSVEQKKFVKQLYTVKVIFHHSFLEYELFLFLTKSENWTKTLGLLLNSN